jgi:hypothetical protein
MNDDNRPITLLFDDGESFYGYRIQPLGHDRWIVADDPASSTRYIARRSFGGVYYVESDGPDDLQVI